MARFAGIVFLVLALSTFSLGSWADSWSTLTDIVARKATGRHFTVAERLAVHGDAARKRLALYFSEAGVEYPPQSIALIAIKDEKRLELFASDRHNKRRFVRTYPVLAASGSNGPKLREGDGQVPEGLYRIESLNPNSRFHLSLRVNYPNRFDRERARLDGRAQLGGDIMIHGSAVSVGCLAIGDTAVEEVFVLAADTGLPNIHVLIAPTDFRSKPLAAIAAENLPSWTPTLYREIAANLSQYERVK